MSNLFTYKITLFNQYLVVRSVADAASFRDLQRVVKFLESVYSSVYAVNNVQSHTLLSGAVNSWRLREMTGTKSTVRHVKILTMEAG